MTTTRRDGLTETAFRQWTRSNPRLDSVKHGFATMDIDDTVLHVWHRYCEPGEQLGQRTINRILFIEEKSFGAPVGFAERDTLCLVDQILRSATGGRFRTLRGEEVTLAPSGCFLLQYDRATLEASTLITWNRVEHAGWAITLSHLEQILRFEIDPDTLELRPRRTLSKGLT